MFGVPRSHLGLVGYAFRALGKKQVPLQQLIFYISFDIRQMPPSQAKNLIENLQDQGQVVIDGELVSLVSEISSEPVASIQTPSKNLGDLLNLFVSSSRLSRAVGMSDQAIDFKRLSQNPLRIEAIVHGSQEYLLTLDEASRRIEHNCPDWRRVSVLHRFCKHVAKLFLILEKDEATRILQSLQQESWELESI